MTWEDEYIKELSPEEAERVNCYKLATIIILIMMEKEGMDFFKYVLEDLITSKEKGTENYLSIKLNRDNFSEIKNTLLNQDDFLIKNKKALFLNNEDVYQFMLKLLNLIK